MVETGTNGPGSGFTQRLLTSDGDIAEDKVSHISRYLQCHRASFGSGWWVMQLVAFHP